MTTPQTQEPADRDASGTGERTAANHWASDIDPDPDEPARTDREERET